MTEKGKFIVIEGLDGSGKTTQIDLLNQHLTKRGRCVYITAEPSEGKTGKLLREALSGREKKRQTELAVLFMLDRIEHNTSPENGIAAQLDMGRDVLCDRYYHSSMAYQGADTDFEWVMKMNLGCPDILRPDLCIFLDLDPEHCIERIKRSGRSFDIFEKRDLLERFRKSYKKVFDTLSREYREKIAIIDASGPPDKVAAEIALLVDGLISGTKH